MFEKKTQLESLYKV